MPRIDASWKPVAFKEWKVVCDAVAAGEQSVILRKGGIAEGKSGFQWIHERFFLFPTGFHQQVDLVRSAEHPGLPQPGEEGKSSVIPITLFVETIATGRLTDWEAICEWEPFHIWTRECIRKRFEWGEEPGISYAVIRAFRLHEPYLLPNRKSFGGCRSWVDLLVG